MNEVLHIPEVVDKEPGIGQELYNSFKKGVLLYPQVDVGGAVEVAHTAMDLFAQKQSFVDLESPLSNLQRIDLQAIAENAHKAHATNVGMSSQRMQDLWESFSGKSLSLIYEAVDQALDFSSAGEIDGVKREMLTRHLRPREKIEHVLVAYPDVTRVVVEYFQQLHGILFSQASKDIASRWKTVIRSALKGAEGYRQQEYTIVIKPLLDVCVKELDSTLLINQAKHAGYTTERIVKLLLKDALPWHLYPARK